MASSANNKELYVFKIKNMVPTTDNSDKVATKIEGYEAVKQFVPYQLCPKCNGQGTISKPPYIAGDVYHWSATSGSYQCDVCNGAKIIPQCIIK